MIITNKTRTLPFSLTLIFIRSKQQRYNETRRIHREYLASAKFAYPTNGHVYCWFSPCSNDRRTFSLVLDKSFPTRRNSVDSKSDFWTCQDLIHNLSIVRSFDAFGFQTSIHPKENRIALCRCGEHAHVLQSRWIFRIHFAQVDV